MYKHCASGLVVDSGDNNDVADFMRKKVEQTWETPIGETTPEKNMCGLDRHSSIKEPKPTRGTSPVDRAGGISTLKSFEPLSPAPVSHSAIPQEAANKHI